MNLTKASIILPVITTIIGAFIGSYLAFGKYKREMKWKVKYDAYREILESIDNMIQWANETYSSCLCLPIIGGIEEKEFYNHYANSRKCISRYINIGKLVINSKAAQLLDEINKSLVDEDFFFEFQGMDETNYSKELSIYAERIRSILDSKLEELITIAKQDLR